MNKLIKNCNISIAIILFVIALLSNLAAQTNPNHVKVKGYYRSNGTYVKPHYRTAPNSTNMDNFSTKGNTNPYTGKAGWIEPDYKSVRSNTYQVNTNTGKSVNNGSNSKYNLSSSAYSTYNESYSSSSDKLNSYIYYQVLIDYNNGYTFEDRKLLEEILYKLSYYPGTRDGIITTQTIKAIKSFQIDNNLVVDGKFGPKSVEKLYEILDVQ